MIKYVQQMKEHAYKTHKARKNRKYYLASDDILTLDIETTSAWVEKGKVIGYRKGESSDYWNSLQPLSLPYIWQLSFNDTVYYGREFTDFLKVLNDLPKNIHFIIWVHNLSFEFHFLQNILECDTVFARSAHKPIKCTFKGYKNVEFRCSYMLTRLSLEDWGKQIGLPKMVGDLDYEKIRTPLTPLTDAEMNYSERDCEVVYRGIQTYVQRYGTQENIPLTQTGTVRREVKKRLYEDDDYKSFIKALIPKSAEEYKRLQLIFAGGYTHANRYYAGEVVRGLIEHYDFTSSYPTVMCCEKYPMTPWVYLPIKYMPSEDTFSDTAYILQLRFTGLQCQTFNTYIQSSKSIAKNAIYDNGRVISADELEIVVTEQDYLTIKDTYTWDSMEVLKVYKSHKEYLPKIFIEYILELYENKTKLKGVEGAEDLYMQSKQYINSLFGMTVTAVIQADVLLNGDIWETTKLTDEIVNEKLSELRHCAWKQEYFLSYSWGCWVTAYARRNLWKCLESVDDEALYCDTDSIFVKGEHSFQWYNDEVTEKLKKACDFYEIDFSRTRPKKPNGKEAPLGIFDKEDDCEAFITLGAKRYVEQRSDHKLYLTVAGINKGAVALLNGNIENFKDGFNFDKDDDSVTKKLATYITDAPVVTYPDGYTSHYTKGINLRRTGYVLGLTDEYKDLIGYFDRPTEEVLTDTVRNSLRGRF